MQQDQLQRIIESAFEARAEIGTGTKGEVRDAVETALALQIGRASCRERV